MKKRWLALTALVVCSVALGVFVGMQSARYQDFGAWKGGDRQPRMLQLFSRRLHLTPRQQAAVSGILAAKHEQVMALRTEVRPKFQAIRSATHEQIRTLLSPEQMQEFDKMEAEFEAKRERWRAHRKGQGP